MTAGTIIKLVFLSLAVGLVLSYFGVTPANFWNSMGDMAVGAWDSGVVFFGWAFKYILIGGAVVVPVYAARSLSRYLGRRPKNQTAPPNEARESREE